MAKAHLTDRFLDAADWCLDRAYDHVIDGPRVAMKLAVEGHVTGFGGLMALAGGVLMGGERIRRYSGQGSRSPRNRF